MNLYERNNPFKNDLVKRLSESPFDEVKIVQDLLQEHADGSITDFFEVLANIKLPEEKAGLYFQEILSHRENMSAEIGRDVGFRVAMLDYFSNISSILDNPAMLEIYTLEMTAKFALMDGLTHLFNRSYFDKAIISEISRSTRHEQKFSLLFIDIDNFKITNDKYGHQIGDKVLAKVGDVLLKNLRREDIACRFGGEEFVVILPETDKEGAYYVANRMREIVSEIKIPELTSLRVTISGGIACYPTDADNAFDLIKLADKATYDAKKSGKNLIIVNRKS